MIITLLVLLGIFLSAFFSSSEIALLSANKLQINVWNKQNKKLSKIDLNKPINSNDDILFFIRSYFPYYILKNTICNKLFEYLK